MCIAVVVSDVGPQFSRSGISGKGKNIVTKHDPEICGRKNARKVMENVRNIFLSVLFYVLSKVQCFDNRLGMRFAHIFLCVFLDLSFNLWQPCLEQTNSFWHSVRVGFLPVSAVPVV